jgi:serine/threonine protein kinase/Tol biopolymer transport system component
LRLQSGTRLGPYEIVEDIGAGGMGEVYRARDTRLARSVAIKVLPAEFAEDVRLRARFEQEAKTISALNHPHICTLLDVGSEDGVDYLVMEYCEGQTLADRLGRGALPLDQVLQYAIDLADALSRAHRAGIVHRDLKPSNVMVTKSGVKLLDFGLAKMQLESSMTDSTAQFLSEEGGILGTIQYMAPEIFGGAEADARSDIFALGLILYEMLTGKRAFSGSNRTTVMAAILEREPRPVHELAPNVPPPFEHLIDKCLSKQPDERWESAHDVAEQLRWIRESKPAPILARRGLAIAAAIVMVVSLGAIAAIWKLIGHDETASVVRISIPFAQPPEGGAEDEKLATIGVGSGLPNVAISPDAKRIVYATERKGESQIYLRQLDSFESVAIAGTELGGGPFFSPDGQWIGFISQGSLMKIPLAGGAPQRLYPTLRGAGRGATWAPDGMIYFCPGPGMGLWKISSNGGAVQKVTEPDASAGENGHRWPQMLPDGKHLLFTIRTDQITSFDDARIAVLSLATGKWKVVLEGGSCARYASGNLLFGRAGSLYAVPFDLRSMSVTGPRRKVVDGVLTMPSSGAAHFGVSTAGDLVYVPGGIARGRSAILRSDVTGHLEPVANLSQYIGSMSVSPDGRKIAMAIAAANDDIWLYDMGSGATTRFSFERGDEDFPLWTADASSVMYTAGPPSRLLLRKANGAGDAEQFQFAGARATSCSSDGKFIVYADRDPVTGFDLWLLPLMGDRKPRPLLRSRFNETEASFSPDGRWIAYTSDETGVPAIYVRAVTGDGGHWQLSTEGGRWPRWSSDGQSVWYRQGDKLLLVPVSIVGNEAQPGKSRPLFTIPDLADYGVEKDGLLIAQHLQEVHEARRVNVILNWKRELLANR